MLSPSMHVLLILMSKEDIYFHILALMPYLTKRLWQSDILRGSHTESLVTSKHMVLSL